MKAIAAREARSHFGALIDQASSEPVLVMRNGRRAVVVLSPESYDALVAAQGALWEARANEIIRTTQPLSTEEGMTALAGWNEIAKKLFSEGSEKPEPGDIIQFGKFRGQLGDLADDDFKQAECVGGSPQDFLTL